MLNRELIEEGGAYRNRTQISWADSAVQYRWDLKEKKLCNVDIMQTVFDLIQADPIPVLIRPAPKERLDSLHVNFAQEIFVS